MSRRMPVAALAISALLLAFAGGAAPARAQESRFFEEGGAYIHEISGAIPAGAPTVRIETDLGRVFATSAPAREVRYVIRARAEGRSEAEARRLLDELVLSASRNGDLIVFKGDRGPGVPGAAPEGGAARAAESRLSAEFRLTVPAGTRLVEIATGGGDVEARDIGGRVTLSTRGGAIRADRIGGALLAETRGGHIDVGAVRSTARLLTAGGTVRVGSAEGEIVVQTSGGDVIIGRAGGVVRAETGGGNVSIGGALGDAFAQTRGGNILLRDIGGQATAATGGGSIRVGGAGGGVRAETAAGPIVLQGIAGPIRAVTSAGNIRADFLPGSRTFFDSELQTWRGDISVSLPEALAMTIRAVVDNPAGEPIRSEFPLRVYREAADTGRPVEMAEGEILGGGSVLKIRTLSGNIVLVKARPGAGAEAEKKR